MKRSHFSGLVAACFVVLAAALAQAEILAMLNYESKPEQMIRKEGLAIIDVDPKSQTFGKMLMDIPLRPDLVAHAGARGGQAKRDGDPCGAGRRPLAHDQATAHGESTIGRSRRGAGAAACGLEC